MSLPPPPLSTLTPVAGKRVTVMGLGLFGGQIAVARYLATQNARVLITDASPPEKLKPSIDQLKDLDLSYRLGEHRTEDFTSADLIVTSPAVPPNSPHLSAARAAGIPIVTEIELTLERLHQQNPTQILIAITGTKGKSTTSALLGRMLSAKNTTHVGGNIGNPLLNQLSSIAPSDWVLLELSSYMLHYLGPRGFRPHIAVVTMVSADHLDWHGGIAPYHAAKAALVAHQLPTDHAILCSTSPVSSSFASLTRAQTHVYSETTSPSIPLLIPGTHNQLNAQGALLAATLLGVPRDTALAAVADFPGLPHRLELVATVRGVRYYNDSIATIPEAAIAALTAFPPHTVLHIVGGQDKHLDMSPLTTALATTAKKTLCIGTQGPALHATLGPEKSELCHTLPAALARAAELATPGDTVLLSPGYPSYDQYPNFQARGDLFRTLAQALK